MISSIDFKSDLTTEAACNAECDNDVSCWGVLSLGTWGCNILKKDNTTINGVVKFNSKSCVCEGNKNYTMFLISIFKIKDYHNVIPCQI